MTKRNYLFSITEHIIIKQVHLLCGLMLLLCVSCSNTYEEFPVVTVKPIHKPTLPHLSVRQDIMVSGTSYGCTILGIPLGNPTIEKAVQDAIAGQGENCVGMSGITIQHYIDAMLLLYGNSFIRVSGNPVFTTSE